MSPYIPRELHRATCRDEFCDWCQNRAEDRKADAEEPLSLAEESRLDTWAERGMGL